MSFLPSDLDAKFFDPVLGPFSWYIRMAEKSGLAAKGLHIIGGVIDRGYTGELKVVMSNLGFLLNGVLSSAPVTIEAGDKICQLVPTILPHITNSEPVEDFAPTDRGADGFGSSGK